MTEEPTGANDDRTRVRLPELSPRAYEHPADRAALTALRKVPGFDAVLKKLLALVGERSLRLIYLGSAVRVSERQLPRVHAIYRDCVETLGLESTPELYVTQTPFVNAGAVGVDQPFLVLHSGTLSLLDDDELRFVLGHELGHVLSGHVLYKSMLVILLRLGLVSLRTPVPGLALFAIVAALEEWDRKSELSCDRAGLLACQSPDAAARAFLKMAGGQHAHEMSVEEFILQADEYEGGGSELDGVFKILNLLGTRHPLHVVRLAELRRWIEAGDYERVLAGDYPKRTSDPEASLVSEVIASARSYQDRYASSKDPLVTFVRDLSNDVSTTANDFVRTFLEQFGR